MDLHFKKIGTQGTPLLILHGLFGSLDNWMTLAKRFSETHTVYLIDQRNHGRSPHSEDFGYEYMAEDLKAFLEKHALEKPILMGHSMGGKTVMQLAVNQPDSVSKLIVVDMAPRQYPVHHQQILDGLNALTISQLKGRGEADKQFSVYEKSRGVRQFLLKNLYRTPEGFAWRFNLPVLTKTIEKLGNPIAFEKPVHAPVLFIAGEKSHYIQASDTGLIEQIFPDAEIKTIADAGHWVHAEQPHMFFDMVYDFIN